MPKLGLSMTEAKIREETRTPTTAGERVLFLKKLEEVPKCVYPDKFNDCREFAEEEGFLFITSGLIITV
jgi:hypothetical protein